MAFPAGSLQGAPPEEGGVNRTDPASPRAGLPAPVRTALQAHGGPCSPLHSPPQWPCGHVLGRGLSLAKPSETTSPRCPRGRGKLALATCSVPPGLAVLTLPRRPQGPSTGRRGPHARAPRHAAPYSTFSPLDLNSMCRICDRHLPNSSRIICSARHSEQRSFSASSPCASRQAHAASTTSREMHDEGHLPGTHRLRLHRGLHGSQTPIRFERPRLSQHVKECPWEHLRLPNAGNRF